MSILHAQIQIIKPVHHKVHLGGDVKLQLVQHLLHVQESIIQLFLEKPKDHLL